MDKDRRRQFNNMETQISTIYEVFRQKVIKKAGRSKILFKLHSLSFVSINAFLGFLNFITPISYPWFLFPLGSTAILLSLHYISKNDRIWQKEYIEKYPVLTDKAFRLLKKIFRKRRFTILSTVFTASVSGFLFMVNIITGPGFLWAAIPAASLLFLTATIRVYNRYTKKELIQKFRQQSVEVGTPFLPPSYSRKSISGRSIHPAVEEAYILQDSILKQLRQIGMDEDSFMATIPAIVENYILQILTLSEKRDELSDILDLNPRERILKEKNKITDKIENFQEGPLKLRYEATLTELEKQLAAGKRIENNNEILNLSMNSALNSIRMLHLDLANLNVEKMSHNEVLNILEQKSSDLSERLEDLRSSFSDLEKDISL